MKTSRQRSPEAIAKYSGRTFGRRRTLAGKMTGYVLSLLALVMLNSCSGGSDILASGGIGGTGSISIGTISELGSIFVNGVEFDTNGASVDYNGSSSDPGMLQVGMVVTVEGSINEDGRTGVATSVVYDDNLQGPISAIDSGAGILTVLGQHIVIDSAPEFDATAVNSDLTLSDLVVGDIIEVSGLTNADGSIKATRITLQPADTEEYRITGQVSNVTADTFQINDLTIDYSQSKGMGMMNGPQNGESIQVTGYLNGTNILVATGLRMMGDYSGKKGQMQLAGYIQNVAGDSFTVSAPMGGITVNIDQGTTFSGGTAADLKPGIQVQVKGGMSMGTLTAQEISFTN